MFTFPASLLIFIFIAIAALHLYWASGGKKWGDLAVPTRQNGELLFQPRAAETMAVATGLLGFAWLIGMKAQLLPLVVLNDRYLTYAVGAIALIFLMRAVGEFRYVGFFKRISHTEFGQMDTKYYSPLCLLIGIISLILAFSGHG